MPGETRQCEEAICLHCLSCALVRLPWSFPVLTERLQSLPRTLEGKPLPGIGKKAFQYIFFESVLSYNTNMVLYSFFGEKKIQSYLL